MKRRKFIQIAGAGAGSLVLPSYMMISNVSVEDMLAPILDTAQKKQLADMALNTAQAMGATYADIRIQRSLNQFLITREKVVQNIVNTQSFGVGVRVIVQGTWGFSATNEVTAPSIKQAAKDAVAIAKANVVLQQEPITFVPEPGYGEVRWQTPIEKNALEIPVKEKLDMMLNANAKALEYGASFIRNNLFQVNEQKYFASTDGSYVDQDIHRLWPTFTVTFIDKKSGKFKTRNALSAPMGMGFEYLEPKAVDKIQGPEGLTLYRNSYDMVADAIAAAQQAQARIRAKSVVAGKYDLVLEPNHLGLTIHESVGHPLELDRVLGYEANYAGTSFATLDKWQTRKFNYGSKLVNLVADRVQPHSLGAVGYDDEGVKARKWHLVKDGILVNYQATRDQAHIIGEERSHGCSYADSWDAVQFQRMPNVSLVPGKDKRNVDELIKQVEKGIYIAGRGSYSIDQQRYNFQFGGQVFYEIKNGAIVGMLDDVAYQSNTQEFWNSCAAICDASDYRLFGTFFDGKGQPGQISAVSHGSSTTRFKDINVINTARKI